MAVGMVDGTPEAIFLALMSLGPSRSEWDFCVCHGSVVECLDGHTDIIHEKLYSDWLPWSDSMPSLNIIHALCFELITEVILYHSLVHKKCPPQSGYVRAHLKSNVVIIPVNQGQQSIVKHMLAIDWKFWKFYLWPSAARSLTISMLKRVAGVRLLTNRSRSSSSSISEWLRHIHLPQTEKTDNDIDTESAEKIKEDDLIENEMEKPALAHVTLMGLKEEPDEFFDVPEASEFVDDDHSDSEWNAEPSSELCAPVLTLPLEQILTVIYPCNIPKFPDPKLIQFYGSRNCIGSQFFLHLLQNHFHSTCAELEPPKLTPAAGFVRKLHDLATQKKGYMDLQEVAKEDTLLYCYGNSLQKDPTCTLPCSWSAGGSSWFLIRGKNYLQDNQKKHAAQGGSEIFSVINLQVDVDLGSSTMAWGTCNLLLGFLNNLVLEMAFIIQFYRLPCLVPQSLCRCCMCRHRHAGFIAGKSSEGVDQKLCGA
ncbi:hypothetical protein V6N12_069982 [Hibiscus sabdariffa]|uniref:Uncharacterized protein n=1 Tax=Hibiscus sabdariffa TaxID=183260 RepID=A0ABR2FG08_9ROSI